MARAGSRARARTACPVLEIVAAASARGRGGYSPALELIGWFCVSPALFCAFGSRASAQPSWSVRGGEAEDVTSGARGAILR
eukprot:3449671-Alexandrium_andersonii.AAC.1